MFLNQDVIHKNILLVYLKELKYIFFHLVRQLKSPDKGVIINFRISNQGNIKSYIVFCKQDIFTFALLVPTSYVRL